MIPKPEPWRKQKARRTRADKKEKDRTRAIVAARDGYCRVMNFIVDCQGPSERNHLRRLSATRNMAPEKRHDPRFSIMNCTRHHGLIDENRIGWEYKDESLGANGRMRFYDRRGLGQMVEVD